MDDLDLIAEYRVLVARIQNEQQTKNYNGKTVLEFARDCSKEATIALMYGLPDEADLLLDVMAAAFQDDKGGEV
jgi:hypothetical protein